MSGNCYKGDKCEFMHGYDEQHPLLRTRQGTVVEEVGPKRIPFDMGQENFPGLTHRSMGIFPSGSNHQAKNQGQLDMAKNLKLKELQQCFDLPMHILTDVFCHSSIDYNIDKAKAVLRLNYPNAERVGAVHNPPAPRISVPPLARKRYKAPPTKWVPTGNVVAEQYQALRAEAIRHAEIRNVMYTQATKGYLAGNKRHAKELSAQAKKHHEKMEQLNAQARDTILASRNQDDSNTLDLHGLHVKEALEVMERFLELKLHSRKYPSVYIISGTGHHSGPQSRSKARLLPAVQDFLESYGYDFITCSKDGRGGCFQVCIGRSEDHLT